MHLRDDLQRTVLYYFYCPPGHLSAVYKPLRLQQWLNDVLGTTEDNDNERWLKDGLLHQRYMVRVRFVIWF